MKEGCRVHEILMVGSWNEIDCKYAWIEVFSNIEDIIRYPKISYIGRKPPSHRSVFFYSLCEKLRFKKLQ